MTKDERYNDNYLNLLIVIHKQGILDYINLRQYHRRGTPYCGIYEIERYFNELSPMECALAILAS